MGLIFGKRAYIRLALRLRLVKRNRRMTLNGIMNRTLRHCWAEVAANVTSNNSLYYYVQNDQLCVKAIEDFWSK